MKTVIIKVQRRTHYFCDYTVVPNHLLTSLSKISKGNEKSVNLLRFLALCFICEFELSKIVLYISNKNSKFCPMIGVCN